MGKKKIDKLKLIESRTQRNVAFCKRKRGFLKKAIELSCLCDQKILIVIYDEERGRVVQFSSEDAFQIAGAYEAIKRARKPENPNNFEKFNNDDYARLEQVDFRSVRYKKKAVYGEDSMEFISELEGEIGSEGGMDKESDKQQSDNEGEESEGQIMPKKSGKRQKIDKEEAKNDTKEFNVHLMQSKKAEKSSASVGKMEKESKDKGKVAYANQADDDESKSLTSNNSVDQNDPKQANWKQKKQQEFLDQQPQHQPAAMQQQDLGAHQIFTQADKAMDGINNQKTEPEADPAAPQDEQKNNLFDADKIRSLGIRNLKREEKKREEKNKRKNQRQQNMFESLQMQNNAFLKNQEQQPTGNESDRYQRLQREVYGILNQDNRQQQNLLGTPGMQQNLSAQRHSPSQSTGNLPSNLIQQLQQKKEMSPQIQQLLQQHLKQPNQPGATIRSQSQTMLQQMVQKAQCKSHPSSQKSSPEIALNQLYNQMGKKPQQTGPASKISPVLNRPAHSQSRSPKQRMNPQSLDQNQLGSLANLQNPGQINPEKLSDPMKNDQLLKTIKSPGYCPPKQIQGIDGQQNQAYGLTQASMPAMDPTKNLAQELAAAQPQGLAFGAGDLGSILQQPGLSSLKSTQDALQATQAKPPQQRDLDHQLNQINQTIASLVDGLGKGQMDTTPGQALQSISSISKIIDNSLPEALNFDSGNTFKANNGAAMVQGQQQKKNMGDIQFPYNVINDSKGSYPGLLDDLQSQLLGQIMRSYGPNPPRMNYAAERTGQNGGTPFFQPQDQRGPVAGAANNFQLAQLQGWNPPATQPQDVQRGQMSAQGYNQPPHVLMKSHNQPQYQPREESIDMKSNFNLSPLLIGDSQKLSDIRAGSASAAGAMGAAKDEQTSQRKLQKQIAELQSQIQIQHQLLSAQDEEGQEDLAGQALFQGHGGRPALAAQVEQAMPIGISEQDLQKFGLAQGPGAKPLSHGGQQPTNSQMGGSHQLQVPNLTDKSPQLVANQFLNERGDFGPSDLAMSRPGTPQQYRDLINKNMQARR